MAKNPAPLSLFENFTIRRAYDEQRGRWLFSVIDIVAVLTEQHDYLTARKYWNKLSQRLTDEGSQLVTKCHRLKIEAADGRKYLTDVADVETILRLIQSVPSKKTEPLKLWLAKTGYERMQEMVDPERALNRSRDYWQKQGRSEKWIQQRMLSQETRSKLTDYWGGHGVSQGKEFAILTNIIHQEWTDLTVQEHKQLKALAKQNLRDHMSEAELIFTALAELSTRQIAENVEAEGLGENKVPAKRGGRIAKDARSALEQQTGKSVVTGANYLPTTKDSKLIDT